MMKISIAIKIGIIGIFISGLPLIIQGHYRERMIRQEDEIYRQAWEKILHRINWTANNIGKDQFPFLADNKSGEWEADQNPKWTGGFWVGMLWLAYEMTGEDQYLVWARNWNESIKGYEEEDNHDRGFVYYYSSVYGYRLTGDTSYYESAIKAARKLVQMQVPGAKVIPQNLKDRENIIIDTMVNLLLLWWAYDHAEESDPYRLYYRQVAVDQAEATLNEFIREDGSTWQSVHYDTITGDILKKHTHQGYSDTSCWSRGESWGLYGFLKAYQATDRSEFLNASIKIGDYIIKHLPEDGVPWYDYDDPDRVKDTSAGAIAAAGFLDLSMVVSDPKLKETYQDAGLKLVQNLIRGHLTGFDDQANPPGILRNGCYQIFKSADNETIWGDYYLMEALSHIIF